jgi:hypothetical protein
MLRHHTSNRSKPVSSWLFIGWVVASTLLAPAAAAEPTPEDKETARHLLEKGNEAFAAEDYAAALDAFRDADAIMGVPTTGLGVARAELALGHLVRARDAFLRVARYPHGADESEPFREAREEALRQADEISVRIPTLTIVTTPAHAVIAIDGARATQAMRRLDPGNHVVEVSAPGYAAERRTISLEEGAERTLEIALSARKPAPKPPKRQVAPPPQQGDALLPWAIGAFALSGAGLAVGIGTGVAALEQASNIDAQCAGELCPAALEGDGDRATTLAHVSTVSFVLAGVATAAGVVLVIAPWSSEGDGGVSALVGPGFAGVGGRW